MTDRRRSAATSRGGIPSRRAWLAIAAIASLIACTPAPPLRYFLLVPTSGAQPPLVLASAGERRLTIGLQPVDLADYLDRSEIVTRGPASAIKLAELDRWGEQLDVLIGRVMTQNLEVLEPAIDVFMLPTSFVITPDRELVVEIDRFDADEAGVVRLSGRWQVSNPSNARVLAEGRPSFEERADPPASYDAITTAMSRALGAFSRDVAPALR